MKPLAPSVLLTSNPASTRRRTAWKLEAPFESTVRLCQPSNQSDQNLGHRLKSSEDKVVSRYVTIVTNEISPFQLCEKGCRRTATSLQRETRSFLVAWSKSYELEIQHREWRNVLKTIRLLGETAEKHAFNSDSSLRFNTRAPWFFSLEKRHVFRGRLAKRQR